MCIKIESPGGDAPKMFGRHFDEKDMVISKVSCLKMIFFLKMFSFQISRESIDACKDWFRDDLQKSDWALMVELKKLFEILWSCVIFTWSKTSWSEQWKINSIVKKLQLPIMCIALFARIYNEIRSFLTIVIFWATGIGLVTGISFNLWIGQVQIRSAR